ncbi:MAG: glycoside hydrolase family 5 protein [Janthinobacterium lividum]
MLDCSSTMRGAPTFAPTGCARNHPGAAALASVRRCAALALAALLVAAGSAALASESAAGAAPRVAAVSRSAAGAAFGCLARLPLRGINQSGGEFNSATLPGKFDTDYTLPNRSDLDFSAALGSNIVRLPFLWERIQPVLNEPLDRAELRRLDAVVSAAHERGLCVILDVHNYGRFRDKPIGAAEVPVAAFHDLWTRLAKAFSDPAQTIFGLMNEPASMPVQAWARIAQSTVTNLREQGFENIVLAPGGRWSGMHEWTKRFDGSSNAEMFGGFSDPLKRTWIEVHQYADSDFSGTRTECIDAARLKPMFDAVSAWAAKNGQRLFLGEFGTPGNEKCLAALETMLRQMQNDGNWAGWTYWSAGRWWGGYPMSIQPAGGQDKPQTGILRRYLER